MEQSRYNHHPWRKTFVVVTGCFLLIAGTIMLVTPGPGLVTIAGGLALLSRVYRWPRRLLTSVRERIHKERDHGRTNGQN